MLASPSAWRGSSAILGRGAFAALAACILVLIGLLLLPARRPHDAAIQPATDARPAGIAAGSLTWGRAPSFSLPLVGGGQAGLPTWRGHPLLLAFWGSWCLPCRAEAPLLGRLAARYARDGLVVAVVDEGDNPAVAWAAQRTYGFHVPMLLDESGAVKGWYAVAGVPTAALISRDGQLLTLHPGALVESELGPFLTPALQVTHASGHRGAAPRR